MDDSAENLEPETAPEPAGEPGFDLVGGDVKAPESEYRVLARKYRPTTFDDLIGQEAMVRTLSNAFEQGRIAHAFMLTGVRGVGKTTTARILARALNYDGPGAAGGPTIHMSGSGTHCDAIMESRHVDVLEMDAASRTGIDDVREIIEGVRYAPVSARYKVYIIDEVHMLSKAAFNGLLKTLEEPPEHVKFIFATTEIRKVPVTVLSRCQRFDLRRLTSDELMRLLTGVLGKEGLEAEESALRLVARAAEGSARDALSLLDQAISHGAGEVREMDVRDMLGLADRARVFDLFDLVMKGDIAGALGELRSQYDSGADPVAVMSDLIELTHWLTRLKLVEGAAGDMAVSETERTRGRQMAEALPVKVLSRAWQMLLKGLGEVQLAPKPIAAAEMVLVRLAYVADLPTPDELAARLQSGNAPAAAGTGMPPSGGAGPRGRVSGGASAQAATAPDIDPAPGPAPVSAKTVPTLARFEDVIALLGEKRDIKLKHALETGARLVSFGEGRIDIALAGAPKTIVSELAEKLKRWTGARWVVSVSTEQGAPTLHEQALTREQRLKEEVRTDPLVKAALAVFPGAEIVAVREAFEGAADAPESEDSDPEDGETGDNGDAS